jgi:hypothetical protein
MQARRESDEKIAASKSERTIAESEEARAAEKHKWQKFFGDIAQARSLMDSDPSAFNQWHGFFSGQGPIAAVPAVPQQQTAVQQALPGLDAALNPQPLPGMAEGGQVQVPPQQPPQQPQQPAALPTQPTPAPTPAANMPSRRERYNKWYGEAAKYAALTGGLEGYQKFQEFENATSRRQVLGYGLQAVQMLDEGNVGEAMRAGNSALESTPFDTGLKFEAKDGKLYMVGKDGKPGQPLNANHLRAFIDNHMKTPEDYLEWKQQYETERSNLEKERTDRRNVATREGELKLAEENAPYEREAWAAGAYRDIKSGDAAMQNARAAELRAQNAGKDKNELTPANRIAINNDLSTSLNNGENGFWGPAANAMMKNPGLAQKAIGDATELAIHGFEINGNLNYQHAAGIAMIANSDSIPGLVLSDEDKMIPTQIMGDMYLAMYDGRPVPVTKSIYDKLQKMKDTAEKGSEE